jgi:hypothetical protein
MSDELKTYGFMDVPRHQAIQKGRGVFLDVYLDGVRQINVVNADDEQGFVVRHKLRDGKTYAEGQQVATERLTGFVEFKAREKESWDTLP